MADSNNYRGYEMNGADKNTALVLPYSETDFLDASVADATPTSGFENCRCISCDVSGVIKIDYTSVCGSTQTEVLQLNAGSLYQVRNVVKLYHEYADQTSITAKSYNSSGVLKTGAIKLHR